jgi:rSAM/selenodomain-associated transferase 1
MRQDSVAIGIFCKAPAVGLSKTRLSPPLSPEECAALSACFIRDLAATIGELAEGGVAAGYAVYTPAGTEDALRELLPSGFGLHLQCDGDFGQRVTVAMRELLAIHAGVILVNADSPTLPLSILRAALDATRSDAVVLSPALDGGYTLIGLSAMHDRLFVEIPWSTPQVRKVTLERAAEIGLPVVDLPGWYDVDDAASLEVLMSELAGERPAFARTSGARAPATKAHFAARGARIPDRS